MRKEQIAIDIVLLLPPEIVELCNELNKESDKEKYVSFGDGNNPHISLAMGAIALSDLKDLEMKIRSIFNGCSTLSLEVSNLKIDGYTYEFTISKTPELLDLHDKCFRVLQEYLSENLEMSMFNELEKINDTTLYWVEKFPKDSVGLNYKPHITLGVGHPNSVLSFPIKFSVVKSGIFQLGPYCTCKKLLVNLSLK